MHRLLATPTNAIAKPPREALLAFPLEADHEASIGTIDRRRHDAKLGDLGNTPLATLRVPILNRSSSALAGQRTGHTRDRCKLSAVVPERVRAEEISVAPSKLSLMFTAAMPLRQNTRARTPCSNSSRLARDSCLARALKRQAPCVERQLLPLLAPKTRRSMSSRYGARTGQVSPGPFAGRRSPKE